MPVFNPDNYQEHHMQFEPKTEAQLADEKLLPVGVYNFTVQVASDEISKRSGNPMVKLQLEVYGEDGRGHKVTDYLMASMGFKLLHFAQTAGLTAEYESGNMPASIMQGRSGKVKIVKEEDESGQYAPKNAVKDYVKPDANAAAQEAIPPQRPSVPRAVGGGGADEVPFMRAEWP